MKPKNAVKEFIYDKIYDITDRTHRLLSGQTPFIVTEAKKLTQVIKEGEIFLYSDNAGNIAYNNLYGGGLFYKDTRFLSCFEFSLEGSSLVLLSSTATQDYGEVIEFTNTDLTRRGKPPVPQETLNFKKIRIIKDRLYENLVVKNYNSFEVHLKMKFTFDADFMDIFEVRGLRRKKGGEILKPEIKKESIKFPYLGEDNLLRETRIVFSDIPTSISAAKNGVRASYDIKINPYETKHIALTIEPFLNKEKRKTITYRKALNNIFNSYHSWEESCTKIITDNEIFNSMIERSTKDIRQLLTTINGESVLTAGIPLFATLFGRDSLISSYEILMLNPEIAKKTLKLIAQYQGQEVNNYRDEEPGKMLHEFRQSELTNIGEIPHNPYYGSVDSTLIFLILLSEYYKWTNDFDFIENLMPNAEKALEWIDNYGDKDGDLFIEYERATEKGLINQSWKDSSHAILYPDGSFPHPPIAVCEVQGYLYLAKKRMVEIYRKLRRSEIAAKLNSEAEKIKKQFNKNFWLPRDKYFAIALDGKKKPIPLISSNPGQCLLSGIIIPSKAEKVCYRLLQEDMYSGWGIRTISKKMKPYNPMSYHNGSIWPHDNALIARGLKMHGYNEAVKTIATGIFESANHFRYWRLPELFCGFARVDPNPPVTYPTSCSPQAWSAGSIFLILQSLLGLIPNAEEDILYIKNPILPKWLAEVEIKDLRIGQSKLDLFFKKIEEKISFSVLRKEGSIQVIMEA